MDEACIEVSLVVLAISGAIALDGQSLSDAEIWRYHSRHMMKGRRASVI